MSSIIEVDLDERYFDFKMKLCRPNGKPVDNLKDTYNKKYKVILGNIWELSFSVPTMIERNHQYTENPLIDKIKLGYKVKVTFKGETHTFVVNDNSKSLSSNGEIVNYSLKSFAYRLSKYDLYSIETEAENLTSTAIQILEETNWTVGTVDYEFDLMYRSITIQNTTVLQGIYDLAKKFNAIPIFNTETRKVDFRKLESMSVEEGLKVREGKYLEDYSIDTTLDEIVTRLKCYGSEGLEFRSLSPTGSNYIQDFSYFTYPFECDSNYNILKSSDFMSDDLCVALKRYDDLVTAKSTEFNNLLTQRTSLESQLRQQEQELSVLDNQMKNLEHELDLINNTYVENAPSRQDWLDVNNNINSKQLEIDAKKNQINNTNNQSDIIESAIELLSNTLATENNFTQEQLDELHNFIYIKDFSDDSIVEEEDLLKAGIETFNKYRTPKVTLKFNMVDFVNDLEYKADRKKIKVGAIITFNSKRFNTFIKAMITEIEYDIDNKTSIITISNDVENNSDEDIVASLLNNINSTSKTLDMNMYKLDMAKHADTMVNQILESAFDTGKNILLGGLENTNQMNERGFWSRDYYNPDSTFLVINGGQLLITKDGARSVEVAINKDGCVSERVCRRQLKRDLEVF